MTFVIVFMTSLSASEKLLNDLRAKYDNIKTFEADIIQSAFIFALNINTNSKGILLIENNTFVLEFTEPMRQFLKVQKNVMMMYMENENTAFIDENFDEKFGYFNLADFLNNQNIFEFLKNENGFVIYKVQNLKEPDLKITMYLNQNDILIAKVEMEQKTGELTTIELHNQKFNQKLSKKMSEYVVPENAVIIKN